MSKAIVINQKVADELATIVAQTSGDPVKNAKALNKSFGYDKQIANFINDPMPKGVALLLDDDKRNKMWDAIQQAGMLTSVKDKRVLALAIVQSDIDAHVKSVADKLTRKGSLTLSQEQKDDFVAALAKYKHAIEVSLIPQVKKVLVELGVADYVEQNVPAPAVAN